MRKWLFIGFLILPSFAHAVNITGWWYTDSTKVARQSYYPPYLSNSAPECSTCVITRVWDGTNINQFAAGNEVIGGAVYLLNGGAADASNVMVKASSFTCQGGTGIVSVSTPAAKVWDTTGRPTQLFNVVYSSVAGISDLPYGHSEFNENLLPPRFRPIGSQLWVNRPDHDTYYPIALVPMEEFAVSSFTVAKSSSQAVWIDTYISTTVKNGLGSLLSGNCTGQIVVTEGATTVATIPYYIKVYNFNFPDTHYFPTTADLDGAQVDARLNGGTLDLPGRQHYHQMLHAHGFAWDMGDVIDAAGNNFPSAEYRSLLDGSAFTPANGYGNARGYNTGHQGYMIGTYRSWHGYPYTDFDDNNAATFCTAISSWSSNLGTYPGITSALYLEDEASSSTMVNSNEKWATWLSTKCTMSGSLIHSWETASAPEASTFTPHVNISVSASVMGHDPNHNYPNESGWAFTPSTWQTSMNGYLTGGTTQGWRYNDNIYGSGGFPKPEEQGFVPRMNFWAMWLKLCAPSPSPGICKGGHFEWQSDYYKDENNANNNNDLPNTIKTFGYYTPPPSAQWGHMGFNYTQGDGVLMWPGTDTVYPSESYGIDGPMATWPLKMYRRGVDDADVMTMASQINLMTTTTTVRSLISQALWEVPCTDQTDCSYNNTTDRTWSYDPNAYTTGIESLYQIIAANGGGPYCGDSSCNNGETCATCPADCGACAGGGVNKTFSGSGTFSGNGTFQ